MARKDVTTPIAAGAVLKNYFIYKELDSVIGLKTVLTTCCGTARYRYSFPIDYGTKDDSKNQLIFWADFTEAPWGSRSVYTQYSEVQVSGSSNISIYPHPIKEGDIISNSLDWDSLGYILVTNDTAVSPPPHFDVYGNLIYPPPYVKSLWNKRSFLATRTINAKDTLFGWIELQANEDSATVTIFKYGHQW